MAIVGSSGDPHLEFISKPVQYPRCPSLYIVGFWGNDVNVPGDATGGGVWFTLLPLPTAPKLPFLPNLDAWYTILGLSLYEEDAAMQVSLRAGTDFPLPGVPTLFHSLSDLLLAGGETAIASRWHWNRPGWENWICRSRRGGGGTIVVQFATNTNAALYFFEAFGLILKPESQLRSEGLW